MSLPGFSGDEAQLKLQRETIEITPKSEWRFEVAFDETIIVKVLEGNVEIFGTELSNDEEYTFTGTKSAIYSHQGAKIEYSGNVASEYTSEETEMDAYINLHFALANFREQNKKAPRVLIVGPKNSGKSSLAKILASYANRMDYEPVVVNLNPSDGVFSLPGSLTASPISDILDVEEGWGHSYTTGSTLLHPKQPNVRYYGYDSIQDNLKFYKHNVSRLGVTVCSRVEEDAKLRESGVIVDTPPLTIKDSALIEDIISDFEINIIVVLGNERLLIDMKKKFSKNNLILVKVPKSGGCVERDDQYIRKLQDKQIREYFYGTQKNVLSPYTVNVDYSVVTIYSPSVASVDSISSVLPIGESNGIDEEEKEVEVKFLEKVEPSASTLQNSVIALLHADKKDDEDIVLRSSVLGFGVVTGVDEEKNKLRILIPVPGRLPDKAVILGQFRYVE